MYQTMSVYMNREQLVPYRLSRNLLLSLEKDSENIQISDDLRNAILETAKWLEQEADDIITTLTGSVTHHNVSGRIVPGCVINDW